MSTAVRGRRLLAWAGVGGLVLITVVLLGWRLHGGSWVRVETASMGTQAPVGTLLWVAPARFDDLRPGDLITFRPPGTQQSYSHLVREVHADGTLSTQGRISAPDPWRLRSEDVVGRAVLVWPGVGWLLLAAPVLALGGLLVGSVTHRLRDRDLRLPVALVGGAIVLAVAVSVYQPLTRAEQLAFTPDGDGARATYVSTGLLPMRIAARGSDEAVTLRSGETGSVRATQTREGAAGTQGRFEVSVSPDIPAWWWAVLVAACLLPAAAGSLGRGRRSSAPVPA